MKLCESCNRPVDYSVCVVVSTNRLSPRFQKCSQSIPFCAACLESFCHSETPEVFCAIKKRIGTAFSELTEHVAKVFESHQRR
jgi:hypothetical protein